ncbi:MAG TPA: antitoxin Xre/MbcA/ParS toxin-binding domain-containing protein [Trueperaceae bacterium]|nr:antitoxin Xre/MbcA/ParS toxin-binding domain-containing protein [Trueperaceae bacterium]
MDTKRKGHGAATRARLGDARSEVAGGQTNVGAFRTLPAVKAEDVRSNIGMAIPDWADFLGVSVKTYERRQERGDLDEKESLKVEMIIKILYKAADVFEDEGVAAEWVTTPIISLDNMRPIDHLNSIDGYERVANTLGKIRYGMY